MTSASVMGACGTTASASISTFHRGSSSAETASIVAAGRTCPKTAPCTAPTTSASAGSTRNMRVRTTSATVAPASASAASMIAKQRRAWRPASSGHEPSGKTGVVPETRTRSPTRTARENPMVGSKGEPEAMRWRGEASMRDRYSAAAANWASYSA